MADDTLETDEAPAKPSKMPLILGVALALLGGGGGFYATWSGMILAPPQTVEEQPETSKIDTLPDIAFVPVDPIVVPLPSTSKHTNLLFRAQLEVPTAHRPDVELLLPRVIDVMNSYLRALSIDDIENPSALVRLRAQMLRRVAIVVGEGRVNDLLIMEFVLN